MPAGHSSIPKVLHFAFAKPGKPNAPLPKEFKDCKESWRRSHTNWEIKQWDAEGNRNLVKEHYPWFLSTYDGFDSDIQRLDSTRYAYMHRFGGIYSDMDVNASWPLDPYLDGNGMVLVARGGGIMNYFLASAPGQPVWLDALQRVKDIMMLPQRKEHLDIYTGVLCTVGWFMLTRLWTQRFNGTLRGKGVANNTKYIVYPEADFNSKLGLNHHFSATWTNSMLDQSLSLQQMEDQCRLLYPDWP